MPFPPKKILFPVDFSERALGASRFVEGITGRFDAELILLHVAEPVPYYGLPESVEHLEKRLAAFRRDEFRYYRVRRVLDKGDDAAERILELSRAENVDLIMMPTHGFGPYRRFILGSVTAKVLHDADCAVWTGVHLEETAPVEELHIRNVVCAIDLNAVSERVVEWAKQITNEYHATLQVVHATPAYETRPARYFDADLRAELAAEAEAEVRKLTEAQHVEAEIDVQGGEVANVVSGTAQRLHADLVVIGRSSESGLVGRLRANAYSIIRQSPCPVISV
ncbi:MAG TPA: universal stress protein [Bryobacteraceae bacterium]|nr:universal stress protein [Bryobacteraceae bacterium]